jgi:hypothetical protein
MTMRQLGVGALRRGDAERGKAQGCGPWAAAKRAGEREKCRARQARSTGEND